MIPRASTEQQRLALKAAARRAISLCGGGDSLAQITRIKAPQLSRCASPDYADFMPVDVALDADIDCGKPVFLAAMAALEGYSIAPLAGGKSTPVSIASAASLIEAATGSFSAVNAALADGSLTRRECEAISSALSKTIETALRLKASLICDLPEQEEQA